MTVTLGIAAVGVYFLLILLFNSLWQPVLVMMAVPFGLVGVIVGFSIHEVPLGFLAATGVIGMIGVVVSLAAAVGGIDKLELWDRIEVAYKRRRSPDVEVEGGVEC